MWFGIGEAMVIWVEIDEAHIPARLLRVLFVKGSTWRIGFRSLLYWNGLNHEMRSSSLPKESYILWMSGGYYKALLTEGDRIC
jgi:hypothetical protein